MKKILLMLLLWSYLFSNGQDTSYLRQHAINIQDQAILGDAIYKAVSDYRLIMIGEHHGINETARFVVSLASLLTMHGEHIQIGLEMPPEWMKKYIESPTDSNIYSSEFFTRPNEGRSSFAWAEIISKCHKNPNIEVFFFDGNSNEIHNFITNINGSMFYNRDSLMYLKIKNRVLLHPTWRTITLSGRLHNRLVSTNNLPTMGCYLVNDNSLSSLPIKILSIDYKYQVGTILSDWGDGLKIHETEDYLSFFSRTVTYENYLVIYPRDSAKMYNGFYFTRKVTASTLLNGK